MQTYNSLKVKQTKRGRGAKGKKDFAFAFTLQMMAVQSEANTGKRRMYIKENEPAVAKIVKRRRRDPLVYDHQHHDVVDQSSTVTGVKRSSKFRGVSR